MPLKLEERIEQGLRSCAIFLDWPADRLLQLARSARMEHYPRRALLLTRASRQREIFAILSGSIEIATTNAVGSKYILSVRGPGQVVRLVQLEDVPALYTYHAREDSQIIHIPAAAMRLILDAEPALWRNIALLMLRRFHLRIDVLQGQALGSIRSRMATILVSMAHRYGDQEIDALDATLRISQADLANMLGLSRQTVGKELARLKDEGLLGSNDGYSLITLLDVPGLLRIANEIE